MNPVWREHRAISSSHSNDPVKRSLPHNDMQQIGILIPVERLRKGLL